MKIKYCPYHTEDKKDLVKLIGLLYTEDPEGQNITGKKINDTIRFLTRNKENGQILVFKNTEGIIGYAILINYWSNEFGGRLVFIDELYILPGYRNRKLGTNFIGYLNRKYGKTFKGIFLQVLPSNSKALNFYTKNGFTTSPGKFLNLLFAE